MPDSTGGRGGRRAGNDRVAKCDHQTPYHPGPAKRLCASCAFEPPRYCGNCGADISSMSKCAIYCTAICRDLKYGRRKPQSNVAIICALPECEVAFVPYAESQRCCCERHGKMLANRKRRAAGLDKRPWSETRIENRERRRARMKGAYVGPKAPRYKIADRDGWICRLCGEAIPRVVKHGHPLYLTIDHIIPLAKGGEHSPSNVQAAHAICNYSKGDRVLAA